MRRAAWLLLLLPAALWLAIDQYASTHAAPGAPTLASAERTTGGAKPDAQLPLIVAIHGLGDNPAAFLELFDGFDVPARILAPRAPDRYFVGTSWFPREDGPRRAALIRERAQLVVQLMEHTQARRKTRGKPIVTGFSQGGILSFAIASHHPDRISAALPIAGALPSNMSVPKRPAHAAPRVLAFHGKRDETIPYADGERTVRALVAAGFDATLTGFEGVAHQIPPAMRATYFAALREAVDAASRAQLPAQVGFTQ